MFGLPTIDIVECLRDSPLFRENLESHEKNFDILESNLEKITKQCVQMVNAGRLFNQEQEQLVHSMWELSSYFSQDTTVQGALNCLLDTLRETSNYQNILIDQAARSIIKKFTDFNKIDMKKMKDKRHYFEKASLEMDSVLHRSSSVTKVTEGEELNKQVWATRQAFRHTALDYMHAISITQAKKRHEIVDAILSYTKAYSTFYHQGSDLCDDMKDALDKISNDVNNLRNEENDIEKSMENRHYDISGKDLVDLNEDRRSSSYPVTMQGYLFKRNNNAFKSWNRRYFLLNNNKLYYRKRSGDETTIMEEDLRLCSVKPAVDVERRFCFEITSNTKSHVLQAESEESCKEWIECLIRGITSALQSNDMLGNLDGARLNSPSVNQSPSRSPSSSPNIAVTNRNKLWRDILDIPGNQVCCDCGSPDPRWASINLGITLCIECSGIHRSLGVHYSKVRSLTLDKWDLEVIKVMEKLGNDVINQIYLSNYRHADSVVAPSTASTLTPASSDCLRQDRENWIKAKYIDRAFVCPLTNEKTFYKILRHRKTFNQRRQARRGRTPQAQTPVDSPPTSPPGGSEPLHVCLETALRLSLNDDTELNISCDQDVCNQFDGIDLSTITADDLLLNSARICHIPLMCLSLALGAKKTALDPGGKSAIHCAIFSKSAIAVEFLLLNGVKVDSCDGDGKTALHDAAIQANILQVYRLIKYRSDWKIKDHNSKTAIDYALDSNEPDLVTLLRVATLSEQLDKEDVDEEMTSIMQELYRKRSPLLASQEDHLQDEEYV